jgi:hypothetical protein
VVTPTDGLDRQRLGLSPQQKGLACADCRRAIRPCATSGEKL